MAGKVAPFGVRLTLAARCLRSTVAFLAGTVGRPAWPPFRENKGDNEAERVPNRLEQLHLVAELSETPEKTSKRR